MRHLKASISKSTIGTLLLLIMGWLFNPADTNAQTSIWQGLDDMNFAAVTIEDTKNGIVGPQIKDDGVQYIVPFTGNKVTLTMPKQITHKYLVVTVRGGDGGARTNHALIKPLIVDGGGAAVINGIYEVGTASNQIGANDRLRFLVGRRGDNRESAGNWGADGGAGTGLFLYKPGSGSWVTLAVAGGGGGAYSDCCTVISRGRSASSSTSGSAGGGVGGKGGTNGANGGTAGLGNGGGGINKAFVDGEPIGSTDVNADSGEAGLFGCGHGGDAAGSGGGGGGYSGGGGAGASASGGGGGSYFNPDFGIYNMAIDGQTSSPKDGYVIFQFTDDVPDFQAIHFAYNPNKCIDDYGSNTGNGTNIQTYTCTDNSNQKWFFNPEDRTVRSRLNTNKCLDLDHSNTRNGTNIQLWDCNGSSAQKWVYNGIHKTIHSGVSSDKCFDAENGRSVYNSNVNVQLWDCIYPHDNQKWTIDGAATVSNPTGKNYIIPNAASGYAVYSHTGAESGSYIGLWTKDNYTSEQWYFDGLAIKLWSNRNLCIDLKGGDTSNGNGIQLYNCNGTNAQKWIYDGMTQTIRSVIDPDKCMQIEKNTDGVYAKRSYVLIQDCNGSDVQLFKIQE